MFPLTSVIDSLAATLVVTTCGLAGLFTSLCQAHSRHPACCAEPLTLTFVGCHSNKTLLHITSGSYIIDGQSAQLLSASATPVPLLCFSQLKEISPFFLFFGSLHCVSVNSETFYCIFCLYLSSFYA